MIHLWVSERESNHLWAMAIEQRMRSFVMFEESGERSHLWGAKKGVWGWATHADPAFDRLRDTARPVMQEPVTKVVRQRGPMRNATVQGTQIDRRTGRKAPSAEG